MDTRIPDEAPARAGRREWLGLAVLALPTLLVSVDMSVLFLAVPHLTQDLQASSTQQLWIADVYPFMIAGFLVTMGTLGDRIGRRKLLLIGGACFGAASLLAAFSTSAEMLIVARALLGISGATLAPSTMALLSNMFKNEKERGTAVAVWSSCFMFGGILGPIVGGLMLSWFWWGSVFLLAIPVMALLLIVGPSLLPEYRAPDAGRLDLPSVALSLLAIIPFIYGIKAYARDGLSAAAGVTVLVGVVFGVLFVRRQLRLDDPLLDLGLFKIGVYRSVVLLGFLVGIMMSGTLLLVNLHLQMVEGLSTRAAGFWLVPGVIATLAAISVTPKLGSTFRPAHVMAAGLLVTAAGCVVLSLVPGTDGLAVIVTALVLINVGLAPMVALGYNMVLGAVPPEKAGSASALSEANGEFGLAAGIAIMGSIATAVYHSGLSLPAGLPADVAAAARENIATAMEAARQVTGPMADGLIASAREAFTTGLNVVGIVGAVMFTALAMLTAHWFRHVPPTRDSEPEPEPDTAEAPA
ncbi:MFS transporter, DHA2 family, multidrug resistance protein [Thermomonospora echinospora]|uniref:MFS transporter, DHA2 family, multidrug resistance protein n=1 Tax=Thermomonospora echinospora TaxID=1992 RepID=A0A1H6CY72_9ACTN|nr:MFS transporter [Thermomonospora echinospora]SEG78129.1 MFS transporter, DHA2 family, multidrug resistance protein [Thermomonospora echinospora]